MFIIRAVLICLLHCKSKENITENMVDICVSKAADVDQSDFLGSWSNKLNVIHGKLCKRSSVWGIYAVSLTSNHEIKHVMTISSPWVVIKCDGQKKQGLDTKVCWKKTFEAGKTFSLAEVMFQMLYLTSSYVIFIFLCYETNAAKHIVLQLNFWQLTMVESYYC